MLDENFAQEIVKATREAVERATKPLLNRIEALEKAMPGMSEILKTMQAIPKDGKDGINGKDGIDGAAGIAGAQGEPGANGGNGVDGANGRDGRDASPDEVRELIAEALPDAMKGLEDSLARLIGKAMENMPKAKDGIDGANGRDGLDGTHGIDGTAGTAGADGLNGANGRDGLDALDIQIMPTIDTDKSYPRGCFATHNGGLWKSFETTRGMRGWECIVNGVEDAFIAFDDERTVTMNLKLSNGDAKATVMKMPVVIYRGVYRKESAYEKGDSVTFAGSQWIAEQDVPPDVPGTPDSGWKLAVKRGTDAKPVVKLKG